VDSPYALIDGLESDNMVFDMLGSLVGRMVGFMRPILKSGVSIGLESVDPFSDDGWAGVKMPCRGLDALGKGVLDHLVTPRFFIFALFHDMVILIGAHVVIEPPVILAGFRSSIMCPFSFLRLVLFFDFWDHVRYRSNPRSCL